jgi:hypothetical protein
MLKPGLGNGISLRFGVTQAKQREREESFPFFVGGW